jgi:hypothetical protein
MLGERSMGIRTLSLISLLALVAVSFWGWLAIWKPRLLFDRSVLERYVLNNEFLLIGILFGLGDKRQPEGPHQEFTFAKPGECRFACKLSLLAGYFVAGSADRAP